MDMQAIKDRAARLRKWWQSHDGIEKPLLIVMALTLVFAVYVIAVVAPAHSRRKAECNKRGGFYTDEQCVVGDFSVIELLADE